MPTEVISTSPGIRLARERRANLSAALGDKCAKCPETRNLQFDCKVPQGWVKHGSGMKARMAFYQKMLAVGNLQLLCRVHHMQKSVEDCQILTAARRGRVALAQLTGINTGCVDCPPPAHSQKSSPALSEETEWQKKCRLVRERLGLP